MRTKDYIAAVTTLLEDGKDAEQVLGALSQTLKRRGHTKLHGAILRGVAESLTRRRAKRQAVVSVERSDDFTLHKEAIDAALRTLGASGDVRVAIDETLIGGFTVSTHEKRIDRSFKQQLVALYRSVTD